MKTIIAPTDFSIAADNACLYAAQLALDIKAELLLFHTMELPLAVAEYPVTADVFDEAATEKELDAVKNKLLIATNNKINITTKNILGSAEYEIKELCNVVKPFAVVMATHTTSLLDHFFLGSTTVYAARHLCYPVIIVPHKGAYKPWKKIALASDLKDIYEMPVAEIEAIVKLFHAEFEVFYSAKNEKIINRNALGSLLLDHRLIALNPQFNFVKSEDVFLGITATAKAHNVDALMIIPKKHGPFHKSKASDFVFYTDIPVIALHENDFAAKS